MLFNPLFLPLKNIYFRLKIVKIKTTIDILNFLLSVFLQHPMEKKWNRIWNRTFRIWNSANDSRGGRGELYRKLPLLRVQHPGDGYDAGGQGHRGM